MIEKHVRGNVSSQCVRLPVKVQLPRLFEVRFDSVMHTSNQHLFVAETQEHKKQMKEKQEQKEEGRRMKEEGRGRRKEKESMVGTKAQAASALILPL